MIPMDKKLHFVVGFILGLFGCLVHPVLGIALSVGAGAAKECYDLVSKKGTPEPLDFLATALGGMAAVMVYGLVKIMVAL